jgi:hypothetical protein
MAAELALFTLIEASRLAIEESLEAADKQAEDGIRQLQSSVLLLLGIPHKICCSNTEMELTLKILKANKIRLRIRNCLSRQSALIMDSRLCNRRPVSFQLTNVMMIGWLPLY